MQYILYFTIHFEYITVLNDTNIGVYDKCLALT